MVDPTVDAAAASLRAAAQWERGDTMAVFWDDCLASSLAPLRDAPAEADHDDERSWDNLGLLVSQLLRAGDRLQVPAIPPQLPGDIFNYWDQPTPPADVAECLGSWRATGLPVQTYDRDSADEYLQRHYGGEVLAAFRYCHHPSMQSDILRMARLLHDGGLYVDADDRFVGVPAAPRFGAGVALIALAVCRHCPASLQARVDDPVAGDAWYYMGSAPWFAVAGHPLVARSLERAVAAMSMRRRKGELAKIHADVGPGCLSMAALDYARACLQSGAPIDLAISPAWSFVTQSEMLGYKATDRNWRRNQVLYPASGEGVPVVADGLP
jgi:hypothetical protein